MSDQVNKTLVFEAQNKLGNIREDLLQLNDTLTEQLTKQKLLEIQGKKNSTAYIDISSQVRLTKQAIRDSNRELDNATKAFNSASNSIQQNRALLSTLTAEYIKLSQQEGQTAASTLKLKGNIDQLTNTLKEQEKAIGQSSRNVGNYKNDIISALSSITNQIPGMQQFSGITQNVVRGFGEYLPKAFNKAGTVMNEWVGNPGRNVIQGFGGMKQSAAAATEEIEATGEGLAGVGAASGEAEAGLAAVTAGSVATGGAIAVLVGIIAGAVTWFQSLGSVGLKSAQVFEGVKASALSFFNDLQKGDMSHFADDIKKAYNNGVELKKGMQDLEFKQQEADETVAQYTRVIDANMSALRYRKITLEQAKEIDKQTGEAEAARVDLKVKLAQKELQIAIGQATNGKKYKQKELDMVNHFLYEDNIAQVQYLEHHDKINKGAADAIHKANMEYIEAESQSDLAEQKSKNRLAIIEERFGKSAAKYAQAQIDEMALAEHNLHEAEQQRLMSISRQLAFTMSAFGKEQEVTNEHYAELIFKQRQFIAQQEKLAQSAKSPEARAKFKQAGAKGQSVIDQLMGEWDTDAQQNFDTNKRKIENLVKESALSLQKIRDAGITDARNKELAGYQDAYNDKKQALDELNQLSKDNIEKLKNDVKNKQADVDNPQTPDALKSVYAIQLQGLKDKLAGEQQAQKDNADKGVAYQAELQNAIKRTNQKYDDQNKALEDNTRIINAKMADENHPNSKNDDALKSAEEKQLDDKFKSDMNQEGLTFSKMLNLWANYNADKAKIEAQFRKQRSDLELASMKEVANASLSILKNSIASNAQAAEVGLQNQKNHELQNQALTSTQKSIIEEKYRVQEGKAKVKAFRANQEASIAEAIINGALAMTKVAAQTGVLSFAFDPIVAAETAASIAMIAAEQPPAYATGGIHYDSDGKGGVLPGYSKRDNLNARLRSGEGIVVSEAMRDPWAKRVVSAINQSYGGRSFDGTAPVNWSVPGFASGGIYQNYLPTSDNGLRPNNAGIRLHVDDMNGIANSVANAVSNVKLQLPPLDVKDVNYQQDKISQAYDRTNF